MLPRQSRLGHELNAMPRLTAAVVALGVAMSFWMDEPVVDARSDSLTHHNGILLHHGLPLNGVVLESDAAGTVRARTPYRHGREHGVAYRWFDNGQLESERHYQSGVKSGHHEGFWPDGSPRFRESFVAGAYHGELRGWHENGRLHQLRHFDSGHETGSQRSWDRNGAVEANYVIRDGRRYGVMGARPCFVVEGES